MRRAIDGTAALTSTHGGPGGGKFGKHLGYDYVVKRVAVKAPVAGKVLTSAWSKVLGNWIELIGVDQRIHRLAHLARSDVRAGQTVEEGDLLGISGNTGEVRGANGGYHLHHDARKAGTKWDASFDNYVDWEKLLAQAVKPASHPYRKLIGKTLKLMPKNGSWRVYRPGTSDELGDLFKIPGADGLYIVRGVDPTKHNRVLINSARYGKGISLPLANATGQEYTGEWKVV